MRYLTLSADYGEVSLRDELQEGLRPEELGVPAELCDRLSSWNKEYAPIVMLDLPERLQSPAAEQIERLDRHGLSLAAEVETSLGASKVRYFSEGLLRHLERNQGDVGGADQ